MIKAVVTDIEGTTSSEGFCKEVLLPFARKHMEDFLCRHNGNMVVQLHLQSICRLLDSKKNNHEMAEILVRWLDEERKFDSFHALLCMIWEEGYQNGDFVGHIYDDVVVALRFWKEHNVRIYLYADMLAQTQKNLFAFTKFGDLTEYFSGYFDSRLGHKEESMSYAIIAADIGLSPEDVLFLSNSEKELEAAKEADMQIIQLVRNGELKTDCGQRQVENFEMLCEDGHPSLNGLHFLL